MANRRQILDGVMASIMVIILSLLTYFRLCLSVLTTFQCLTTLRASCICLQLFPVSNLPTVLVSLLLIFGTPGKISCILWLVLFLDTHGYHLIFIHSFILQEQWRVKWNDNLKKVQYAITAIYKWVSNSWIQEPMDALKWKRVWVLICLWLVRRLDPISSWGAESNMDPAKGGHMVEAWTSLES